LPSSADETSYINYIKPLILAAELNFPHVLSVIDTRAEWFYAIHPERMVPSLKDRDPETGQDVIVFEGTACLQYLADRFDQDGRWTGRTAHEKGSVYAWTAYQTAGIGYVQCCLPKPGGERGRRRDEGNRTNIRRRWHRATAKYWLYFVRGYPTRANPVELPRTIAK
jgi:glutathione S-transferase